MLGLYGNHERSISFKSIYSRHMHMDPLACLRKVSDDIHIRSDLTLVFIYIYSYRIHIQDATDLKLKVNQKHDMTSCNANLHSVYRSTD